MIRTDRLAAAMADAGLSQAQLASRVGLSASAIQQLLNGSTKRTKYGREIAWALGVTEGWLLGETEQRQGDLMDRASDHARALMHVRLSDLSEKLPDYDDSDLLFFDHRVVGFVTYRIDDDRFFLAISQLGRDMVPTLWPNDIVIVEATSLDGFRAQDDIWAVDVGGVPLLRRIRRMDGQRYTLSADNPELRDMTLLEGEFGVIGLVVWYGRQLRPDEE